MNSEDGKLSDRTSWKTSDSDDGKEKTKINLRPKSIGKDIPYSLKIWLLPIWGKREAKLHNQALWLWWSHAKLAERERERERESVQEQACKLSHIGKLMLSNFTEDMIFTESSELTE